MSWLTGKTNLVVLGFGDSNLQGTGGYQLGVQQYNPNNLFYTTNQENAYDESTLAWRQLSNDSTLRDVDPTGNDIFIGQQCGGNGAPSMQLADTLQQLSGIPVYTAVGLRGGSTAEQWLDDLWPNLVAMFTAALATMPVPQTYADVFYISNGGADLFWGSPRALSLVPGDPRNIGAVPPTAEQWYARWAEMRSRLIAEGFWIPGVTQIVIGDIPINQEFPAYPAWQGLQFAINRTNDRMKIISGVGLAFDPAWNAHYTPASYTVMGKAAGTRVFHQIFNQQAVVSVGGNRVSYGGSVLRANA
jgi:hypothetical protein